PRTPQVRYTYPLAYGMSVAVAAENPSPNYAGPFGTFFTDTNQIPNSAACAALTTPAINGTATGTATIGGTTVASNITNACLGNAAFFNPSQDIMPNFVATKFGMMSCDGLKNAALPRQALVMLDATVVPPIVAVPVAVPLIAGVVSAAHAALLGIWLVSVKKVPNGPA